MSSPGTPPPPPAPPPDGDDARSRLKVALARNAKLLSELTLAQRASERAAADAADARAREAKLASLCRRLQEVSTATSREAAASREESAAERVRLLDSTQRMTEDVRAKLEAWATDQAALQAENALLTRKLQALEATAASMTRQHEAQARMSELELKLEQAKHAQTAAAANAAAASAAEEVRQLKLENARLAAEGARSAMDMRSLIDSVGSYKEGVERISVASKEASERARAAEAGALKAAKERVVLVRENEVRASAAASCTRERAARRMGGVAATAQRAGAHPLSPPTPLQTLMAKLQSPPSLARTLTGERSELRESVRAAAAREAAAREAVEVALAAATAAGVRGGGDGSSGSLGAGVAAAAEAADEGALHAALLRLVSACRLLLPPSDSASALQPAGMVAQPVRANVAVEPVEAAPVVNEERLGAVAEPAVLHAQPAPAGGNGALEEAAVVDPAMAEPATVEPTVAPAPVTGSADDAAPPAETLGAPQEERAKAAPGGGCCYA